MSVEVGSILQGKVTGITTFGVFVSMENGVSGLVHISEISNDYVADINQIIHIGMEVKVKVLSKDAKGKLSLSIKQAEGSVASASSGDNFKKGKKNKEPLDPFEEMMKKFKQQSEEKIHDLKRKENK